MTYEVELKFPLDDSSALLSLLDDLNAEKQPSIEQTDLYFAHPVRDFATTDEALRLRSTGDKNRITYKGSLLDSETKSRREIEVSFADGTDALSQFTEILSILGFQKVRRVSKTRTPYTFTWQDRPIELVLDEVHDLGLYLEIETLSTEDDFESARQCILNLATHLGLENSERRSYLCLLLEMDESNG